MVGYVIHFDGNETMSSKATDIKLLKKYTKIWGNINNLLNIEFDKDPVYHDNDKYLRTKIKSFGEKINTNSQSKKYQKRMHHVSAFH